MIRYLPIVNFALILSAYVFFWLRGSGLLSDAKSTMHDLRESSAVNERTSLLLLEHLQRLSQAVDRGIAGVTRIEIGADRIAVDLAETHARADAVAQGHAPGTASDAASRSNPVKEK